MSRTNELLKRYSRLKRKQEECAETLDIEQLQGTCLGMNEITEELESRTLA